MTHRRKISKMNRTFLSILLLTISTVQCKGFASVTKGAGLRLTSPPIKRHGALGQGAPQIRQKPAYWRGLKAQEESSMPAPGTTFVDKLKAFLNKNFFLTGMILAVTLARLAPSIGKSGGMLRPELFVGKFGVTMIFLLSGLSIKASELTRAFSSVKLNAMIQLTTFLAWPYLVGLPLRSLLNRFVPNLIQPALADGLLILTCLPTTVNMCVILASSAGGNVATALCNSVISNMGGIFLTPALLFQFFGTYIKLPFLQMVIKLCKKVLVPVAIGQALRGTPAVKVYNKNSKLFGRLQEVILLGILYNAFCDAFSNGLGLALREGVFLATALPLLHLASAAFVFKTFSSRVFGFSRPEVVSAVYCASQKTLAFGLPLVQTIFDGSPNLAAYCSPIMFIHPLQMIVGSLLVPRLLEYTSEEEKSD